jgi:hypothetical protein
MIEKFNVQGFFYNQDDLKFRRFLEIKRKNVDTNENDLSVIMMNPGSSRPKNLNESIADSYFDKFVEAHPDSTQSQIMKIMDNCGFNYAKIVNLSDIRNTNSTNFYKMLDNELKNHEHSIFSEKNKHLIKDYLNPKSVFIFAWGVDKKLENLAKQALQVLIDFFGNDICKVYLEHSNKYGYYHPLPKTTKSQKEWVEKITNKINAPNV